LRPTCTVDQFAPRRVSLERSIVIQPATYTLTELETELAVWQQKYDSNSKVTGRTISSIGYTGDALNVDITLESATGAELAALSQQYPKVKRIQILKVQGLHG
jgi:hypothetical protein